MKTTARELAAIGARTRIKELEVEIEELKKIANGKVYRQKGKKKLHWTQTKKGRERMAEFAKNRFSKEK